MPGGVWPETPDSALVLPVKHLGQDRLAGFLVAGLNTRRSLDDDYRGFLDLLAGQIATALANARAYEEERRRAESLAELDRAKTAFFSNVSHEFRTPLSLMLGPVEDILARPDRVHPEDRESLSLVQRNALRLQKLVNTLLDFSRIEAGRVKAAYEPIDLPSLTSELASNFRSACEKAGLVLSVDCPPLPEPVYVDRDMWEKVVLNLLSNAFKFTHRGRIGVRLRSSGRQVELTVQDTGIGIPPEELPNLFERFHRIEGAGGRTQEGTGIGLALVRELAHLHGGEVRAESEHGVGSVFFVTIPLGTAHLPADRLVPSRTLASTYMGAAPYVEEALRWLPDIPTTGAPADDRPPFARPECGPSGTSNGSPTTGDRPTILLADDNADMREYVRRLLADRYEVTAVADGLSALAAAREQPPDLILTDVMMPGLDGFGLLGELRADVRTRDVPVLLLSARAGEEARVEGLEAGADEYITKPFNARVLLASVRAHLELARMRRAAGESLRRGEERLVAALTASDTGTFRWDPETGAFLDFDDSLKRLFGFTPDETVRTVEDCLARVHPDDRPQVVQAVDRCRWGADFEMEFRVILPAGSVRWLFDRGKMMHDDGGRPTYLVGACTDITDRKLIEEALKDADRRKDEFLATLAHELRNPLAPIRNAPLLMRRPDGGGEMEPERAMAERQVVHLARLIEDLMDVARISRGQIELHKTIVDLATVVNQAVQTARTQIDDRRHRRRVSLPEGAIRLDADPTRLEQVLWNLLNNSAKYTDPGGEITLAVEPDGGEFIVRVRDTGIGIRPEMLPKVFDMFVQVGDHKDHAQGGLGIGLSPVRTLVEMHGGSITAHSAGPGTGSVFVVRLPLLADPPEVEAPASGHRRSLSDQPPGRRRILVVDDNDDAANSLARLLSRLYNQDVRVARDGPEALNVAQAFQPEVILLDIGLPGMDGNEVTRRLRERPEFGKTMIVALTGWGQESDVERSRAAGFDHHLVKPADPEAIVELLSRQRVDM